MIFLVFICTLWFLDYGATSLLTPHPHVWYYWKGMHGCHPITCKISNKVKNRKTSNWTFGVLGAQQFWHHLPHNWIRVPAFIHPQKMFNAVFRSDDSQMGMVKFIFFPCKTCGYEVIWYMLQLVFPHVFLNHI
jgi:hypothetical protein